MKLIKKGDLNGAAKTTTSSSMLEIFGEPMARRTFLYRSGLTLGGATVASMWPLSMMKKTEAKINPPQANVETTLKRSVCTHCSVGCGVIAEIQNGVWTGQEPDFDSPFNLGAHCAKGASVREHGHGERRVKYPMKLVNGKWKRIAWEQAIEEIGDKLLEIREQHGPDAVFWCGSSKASNEGAYLQRKFAAFWGTNNCDHQARICHSTTVAGVANTWGYGAMTNSYNDMHNCKAMLFIGSNAAEAHPVAMQHILRGKENGAVMIVVDPRFTRTAAHADQYLRIRPGTDVPFMWGLLWHIFENGWEDKAYLRQRVYGMEEVRQEVKHWTPEVVENVTGVPEPQMYQAAKTMAENRPGTIVWCIGATQHHVGNNNTRAYCIFQLALGNIGMAGGGANIFRGHDNVQGATDVGPNSHTLPGYYGLSEEAWRHWARVWDVEFEWLKDRFDTSRPYPVGQEEGPGENYPMFMAGIPVSRWIDGILEEEQNISQRANFKALFYQGHAANSLVRGPEMKKALEKIELLVISDPYPTHLAVMSDRKNNTYLLPTATQFESYGSVTNSSRSIQWREKIMDPLFESLPDHVILYKLAKKLGFAEPMFKHIQVQNDEPLVEDVLREINRGTWSIGYTGQSPERLKLHAEHRRAFDTTTLQAKGGPVDGEYYGLPWPCWGPPEMKHPGTPILYDTSKPVAEGGGTFRARFGVEHQGVSLLADGVYSEGSELKDGYPEFTYGLLRQLGWDQDLTPEELKTIAQVAGLSIAEGSDNLKSLLEKTGGTRLERVNWKTDLSGGIQRVAIQHGCSPYGNAKARCVVWQFPDPVPVHREPLYTSRHDLVAKYPTYEDRKVFWRLPTRYTSIQAKDYSQEYPLIFTSGRLVEYEGGGAETRSNLWLAELQQEMFVEINPTDAYDRGLQEGDWLWLEGPEGGRIKIKAMITPRVAPGVVWTPYHFGGWFQGKDLLSKYPQGTAPYVRGEACNTAMTYGYDSVTQMQETKATLCQIWPA
ncbi:molybdopterin oxidoreductase [Nitrosococcus halophilus Nc 4]|uniref:Molybdopterin oxidoreductase n=1 Tax=Nitrosococcus halophilus (strain Nc4) TaxID=472759 RepID=D5C294_NITHN|nr:formate dehydrogenase subunit alpha [Nitrosococcus halophilus]ADE14753.1 molybdopterin oxidoreductase [Nitrosococcus halophilus Nc 4]